MLPTPEELQAFLEEAGAWHSTLATRLQKALDDTEDDWHALLDYSPFLADGAVTNRVFNAPGPNANGGGRVLFLKQPLHECVSVAVDGTFLTPATDYVLEPVPGQGEPATMVKFTRPVYALPQGISIAGKWGWAEVMPRKAKSAILAGAAAKLAPLAGNLRRVESENAPPVEKAREAGSMRQEFSVQDAAKLTDFKGLELQWSKDFSDAAEIYRVVSP